MTCLTAATILCAALTAPGTAEQSGIAGIEQRYLELRNLKDAITSIRVHNGAVGPDPATLPALVERFTLARESVARELQSADVRRFAAEDRRAVETMRAAIVTLGSESAVDVDGGTSPISCGAGFTPATADAKRIALEELSSRLYECFGAAAGNLAFEGESLDRLTVLARLAITDEPDRRRGLFLALGPVWAAINGDGTPASPWRSLIKLSAARMRAGASSIESRAALLSVDPLHVEPWLVAILARWRDATSGAELEPWDFYYAAGAMERALSAHIPLDALRPLNDRVYRDLGADPVALRVQYDLAFRAGKYPVAHTDFLSRPQIPPATGGSRGAVRVSASYRVGGAGNLAELLHETGHAIHIAAIRTRPAFADWPDSDTFSEALGDLVALDVYEPEWQQRYLGNSVPADQALRAKYAGVVLDTAWALFEIYMHRDPDQDPNRVWTKITREYLHIRPHAEWSWWAVRGQLVSQPGYMLNYALGAILAAELRARTRELFGARPWGDASWYGAVSERLYRFGLERPSREVIEEYLGRPVSPAALLQDMGAR
ncbi:MAG: hypothetical protein HYR49_05200 [Gammaproteobacteria bacterium]|nr:hypothetical protein [Gammaproteobacteria bacterium]